MVSVSRDMTLPNLRNMLITCPTRKTNFPTSSRILPMEFVHRELIHPYFTGTSGFVELLLFITDTHRHTHKHTYWSNTSQNKRNIPIKLTVTIVCLSILTFVINTTAVSSCFFTCNITFSTMPFFRGSETYLLAAFCSFGSYL